MPQFNAYHIKQFNQKCKHLVGEGKIVLTHKECRDLQSEIMDLLLHVNELEKSITALQTRASENADISVELVGKPFK